MTRVQVLDVGDRVTVVGWPSTEYIVLGQKPSGRYHLCQPADSAEGWQHRESLNRVGGDLQVGDFVKVFATTPSLGLSGDKGIIVDDYPDGCFSVYLFGHLNSFNFASDDLTRITKAEALA